MTDRKRPVVGRFLVATGLAIALLGAIHGRGAGAAEAPVGLGTATSFAVLGGSTVTNTGPSVITGDVGVSPGSATPGFGPPAVVNGTFHNADAVANQAQLDVTTAYNDAAGRATSATITADLGGQTLVPGVYTGATLGLTGTLTLSGDANAVFIFQSASTLITSPGSAVVLIGGATACNVYWQLGTSATLGTNSTFVGTILALASITAETGATIQGRLFARSAAVTLDTNVVSVPTCAALPPTTVAPTTTTTRAPTTTSTIAPTTSTLAPTTTTTTLAPTTTSSSLAPTTTSSTLAPTTTTSTLAPTTTSSTLAPTTTTSTLAPTTTTSTLAPTTTTTQAVATTQSTQAVATTQSTQAAMTTTTARRDAAATSTTLVNAALATTTTAPTFVSGSGGQSTTDQARSTTGGPTTLPTTGTSLGLMLIGAMSVLLGTVLLVGERRLRRR